MTTIIKVICVLFVGLASGGAVGAGFVAFIAVLGIIPRLMQLTKSMKMIFYYEWATTLGVIVGSWISLQEPKFSIHFIFFAPIGLAYGIFVGMLASALYEILNVFPILFKRIKMQDKLIYFLMALVFGKIIGSLFHWLYFAHL